jgi:hypothetical protein
MKVEMKNIDGEIILSGKFRSVKEAIEKNSDIYQNAAFLRISGLRMSDLSESDRKQISEYRR